MMLSESVVMGSFQVDFSSYSHSDEEVLEQSERAARVLCNHLRDAKQELLRLGLNLNWCEPGVGE